AAPDYWGRGTDPDGELSERYWTSARGALFRRALEDLAGPRGTGAGRRLVDLGGGVGYFAKCALDAGWDAYSVDPSPLASAAATARLGQGRSLVSAPAAFEGTCELVTLWCVIAHLPDPRKVLANAARLLSPTGRLFLTTPNFSFQRHYAAALARLARPIDFAGHDHLLHFTPESVRRVMAAAGLRISRFTFAGITEDCLANRRLATWLVPAKRAWNHAAHAGSRLGLPLLMSDLQVIGGRADPLPPEC
ncbi:MAG: class I SAM-dependent methyltransferase, partial [Acidimicrobiales bacterium]